MEIVKKYFSGIEDEKMKSLEILNQEFANWNEKINCVSRKDIEHLEVRHILHSLAIAKHISFPDHSVTLDIGTGGGFPGLPLAILFPQAKFILIDSIEKKISVVRALVKTLGLKNVEVYKARAENFSGKFDFVVTRAVARAAKIGEWIKTNPNLKMKMGGRLIMLKGGDLEEELRESNMKYNSIPIQDLFDMEFFENKFLIDIKLRKES